MILNWILGDVRRFIFPPSHSASCLIMSFVFICFANISALNSSQLRVTSVYFFQVITKLLYLLNQGETFTKVDFKRKCSLRLIVYDTCMAPECAQMAQEVLFSSNLHMIFYAYLLLHVLLYYEVSLFIYPYLNCLINEQFFCEELVILILMKFICNIAILHFLFETPALWIKKLGFQAFGLVKHCIVIFTGLEW